jgi:hypothetical protein
MPSLTAVKDWEIMEMATQFATPATLYGPSSFRKNTLYSCRSGSPPLLGCWKVWRHLQE